MMQKDIIMALQKAKNILQQNKIDIVSQDEQQLQQTTTPETPENKKNKNLQINNSQVQLTQTQLSQAIKQFNTLKKEQLNKQQQILKKSASQQFQHFVTKQQSQEITYNFNSHRTSKIEPLKTHLKTKSDTPQDEKILNKFYLSLIKQKTLPSPCQKSNLEQFSSESNYQYLINNNPQLNENQDIYYLSKVKEAFQNQQDKSYFLTLARNHFKQTCQELQIGSKLKPTNYSDLKQKQLHLKQHAKYQNSITLVFDLDETLVHCNQKNTISYDVLINIQSKTQQLNAFINFRPYLKEVLQNLANNFELIVFTASNKEYAKCVIDYIDPHNLIFSHRLYKDSCILTNGGVFTKDLRVINRDPSKIILIDNSSCNFAWQLENGIPILPYYDNKEDQELLLLQNYLFQLKSSQDVRKFNKTHLQLEKCTDKGGFQVALQKLFQIKF